MKLILLITVLIVSSCSTFQSRRVVDISEIGIKNGVYNNQEWSSKLKFKRYSWYKDSTMTNEILLAELDRDSDFSNWLGKDKYYFSKCSKFYIGLFYSDSMAKQKNSFFLSQLNEKGYSEKTIVSFEEQLKAHQNFKDWRLFEHKVLGLCQLDKTAQKMEITVPGFKSQVLK